MSMYAHKTFERRSSTGEKESVLRLLKCYSGGSSGEEKKDKVNLCV